MSFLFHANVCLCYSYTGPVYHIGRGSFQDTRGHSPVTVKPRSRLPPLPVMKSFEHFVSDNEGLSLSSEEALEKYKKYQLEYTEDISKQFFQNNKYDEWFRETYDPVLVLKQVGELKQRAQQESAVVSAGMQDAPEESLASMRLYRSPSDRQSATLGKLHPFPPCSPTLLCHDTHSCSSCPYSHSNTHHMHTHTLSGHTCSLFLSLSLTHTHTCTHSTDTHVLCSTSTLRSPPHGTPQAHPLLDQHPGLLPPSPADQSHHHSRQRCLCSGRSHSSSVCFLQGR
mgnify:CR=1 FL=1